MQLSTDIVNDYLVVELKGELDHHTSEDARKKIEQYYYNNNLLNIILDLSQLKFMDSSGIGLVMGRYKNCKERNGNLLIVSTSPYVNKILKMSGLMKIIKVYSTIDEAIKG
ncbi:anti-sigma F factor antagonist [Schnuerera sp. xch1]|uniref:anti-sigma F factor antagonist n=1 Tax=Schnuerera sp. xch1 TaxID=2874283 RepID=UPI001CBE5F52|nr:anti-sigma F factor antagonist [Schnuerera sp. xch1]MBZ2173631.1 anti-sigma F factor antagonist [Schnuerera sp. xch1]